MFSSPPAIEDCFPHNPQIPSNKFTKFWKVLDLLPHNSPSWSGLLYLCEECARSRASLSKAQVALPREAPKLDNNLHNLCFSLYLFHRLTYIPALTKHLPYNSFECPIGRVLKSTSNNRTHKETKRCTHFVLKNLKLIHIFVETSKLVNKKIQMTES